MKKHHSEMLPYVCKKHGPIKPKLQLRPSGYWHRRCPKCFREVTRKYMRAYVKVWNKQNRKKVRARVLELYGNKCECCNEATEQFLTIDHINNDGKYDRQRSGCRIYGRLDSTERMEGYRILCFNCNLGRAKNDGICPHSVL